MNFFILEQIAIRSSDALSKAVIMWMFWNHLKKIFLIVKKVTKLIGIFLWILYQAPWWKQEGCSWQFENNNKKSEKKKRKKNSRNKIEKMLNKIIDFSDSDSNWIMSLFRKFLCVLKILLIFQMQLKNYQHF